MKPKKGSDQRLKFYLNMIAVHVCLTLCIRETPKCVPLQTVKTIRVFTVCKGETDLQTKENNFFEKYNLTPHRHVQWTIPSKLGQTRRMNQIVYKGLKSVFYACLR